MTKRVLMFLALMFPAMLIAMSSIGAAQARMSGKWSTDPAPKGWAGWTESGSPKVFSEQPNLAEPSQRKALNVNAFGTDALLDLKVEGNKVSGFLGLDGVWEPPMKVELGTIEGNALRFLTTKSLLGRDPIYYQWIVELSDDNTAILRGGNVSSGRPGIGADGRLLQPGQQPTPAPTSLPPLNKSSFRQPFTLHRVK